MEGLSSGRDSDPRKSIIAFTQTNDVPGFQEAPKNIQFTDSGQVVQTLENAPSSTKNERGHERMFSNGSGVAFSKDRFGSLIPSRDSPSGSALPQWAPASSVIRDSEKISGSGNGKYEKMVSDEEKNVSSD